MNLSVVISSYNQKEFLIEAIESCLQQNFNGSYEIVIGDDGSDDGSIEVIKDYVARYPDKFRYFVADRNDGVDIVGFRASNIREKAVHLSRGEYIIILDGDDKFIRNDSFQKQMDFLQQNPQYVACYTDFSLFTLDGKKEIRTINYSYISTPVFWSQIYVHLTCFMFRRKAVDYFIPLFVNDCAALFSILKAGKIYHLSESSFSYRQLNNSMYHSFSNTEKCTREILVIQAIKNSGKYWFSTLARYNPHIQTVFQNRSELKQEKYHKYFRHTNKYPHDYLQTFKDYDNLGIFKKLSVRCFLLECKVFSLFFKGIRIIKERKGGKNVMTYTFVE